MKTLIMLSILAVALVGCKVPGQKASFNADDQAFCKTNYTAEDMCVADAKCEWKLREDGQGTCRAKR
jgi:hypothetical protein